MNNSFELKCFAATGSVFVGLLLPLQLIPQHVFLIVLSSGVFWCMMGKIWVRSSLMRYNVEWKTFSRALFLTASSLLWFLTVLAGKGVRSALGEGLVMPPSPNQSEWTRGGLQIAEITASNNFVHQSWRVTEKCERTLQQSWLKVSYALTPSWF